MKVLPARLAGKAEWRQRFEPPTLILHYDVAPDGRRFLIVSSSQQASSGITLVVNWTAEVQR